MKFPDYVPATVRASMTDRLEGTQWSGPGRRHYLERAESRLEHLKEAFADQEEGISDAARMALHEARDSYLAKAKEVFCLERLVEDERMRAVYRGLAVALPDEEQQEHFITAAWQADRDYGRERERERLAEEARREIADLALQLADALQRAKKRGVGNSMSPGIFGMRQLIEKTEHEPGHRDLDLWHNRRHAVFDSNAHYYIWSIAPDTGRMLVAMAHAAQEAGSPEPGAVEAALSSRRSNRKAEFLRAFVAMMRERRLPVDPPIHEAMAITATVVLNDAELDVSRDDVRKAVGSVGDCGSDVPS
jgi:hypothetical protein